MATKTPSQIIEYVDFWFPTNYRGLITAARQRTALFDLVMLTGTTSVISVGLNVPPTITTDAAYVIGPAPTGLWAGQPNKIAYAVSGEWQFYPPPPTAIGFDYDGLQVWASEVDQEYTWTGLVWEAPSGSGAVDSVFGRTGAVIAVSGDYTASLVTNDSGVSGATVADALNTLLAGSGISDGDYGDVTVSLGGTVWTINANVVSFAKLQQIATDTLLGRDTGGTGDVESIGLNTTLSMDGAGNLQRSALSGDVAAPAGSNATTLATVNANTGSFGDSTHVGAFIVDGKGRITAAASIAISYPSVVVPDGDYGDIVVSSTGTVWTIDTNAVTFAKFQQIATDSLLGRDTAGTGNVENITLNATLSMTGAGALQRAALTGDATAPAGSNALTFATVNANVGSFGSASQTVAITVNAKGLVTAAAQQSISITASQVSDFNNAAEDAVGGILLDSATIDFTYTSHTSLTAIVIDNSISNAKFRQGVARSIVGVTGNATANVADVQGTTDQVLRVNGAGTAVAFGAIDLSKSAAASGVLQAASFPALTGDLTTVAGALATTLATMNSNVGTFGSATQSAQVTVNGKGLVTAVSNVTISGVAPPDGDKGDITVSSTGTVWTIDANVVTDAKLRQGVARSVIGVTGNATANVADIQGTTDQVLRINAAGTALAFGAIDISKTAAVTGVLQAASYPATTGDVTSVAGALATTIANDVVTNAKLANMATQTVKGRNTALTGDPEDLSMATLSTMLNLTGLYMPLAGGVFTGVVGYPDGAAGANAIYRAGETANGIFFSAGQVHISPTALTDFVFQNIGISWSRGSGQAIDITSTNNNADLKVESQVDDTTGRARILTRRSNAGGALTVNGVPLGVWRAEGHNGTNFQLLGTNTFSLLEAPTATAMGTGFKIALAPRGTIAASEAHNLDPDNGMDFRTRNYLDGNSLFQLRSTSIAGAFTGAAGKLAYFNDLGGGASNVVHNGTNYKRVSDGGYGTLATNADATLTYLTTSDFLQHTGALTAIRTLTLSTTGAVAGAFFTVYRTGTGNFALVVAGATSASLFIGQFVTFRFDGAAWQQTDFGTVAPTEVVRKLKTTGENRNATTVLASDATLQFPVAANTTYRFTMKAFYDTLAAADLKWRTSGPAGATAVRIKRGDIAPAATVMENIAVDVAYSGADIVALTAGTTGGYIEMEGIIQNGATAGTFALQWAQNTSTVGNSTMLAGSWLEYQVIA